MDKIKFDEQKLRDMDRENREQLMRYSLPTLMGNWLTDLQREEERMEMVQRKVDRCEMFGQKKKIVLDLLYTDVNICKYQQYIVYELPMQIVSAYKKDECATGFSFKYMLATTFTDKQILEGCLTLRDGNIVIASKNHDRQRRNIWAVISQDPSKVYKAVTYSDEVYIKLYNTGSDRFLYLGADVPNHDSFGLDHFPVFLRAKPSRYTKFRFVHPDIDQRMVAFHKGGLVSANSPVLLTHVMSNRLFALEEGQTLKSITGKENLVTCYTYKEINKVNATANLWIFVTKVIGEDEVKADIDFKNEQEAKEFAKELEAIKTNL